MRLKEAFGGGSVFDEVLCSTCTCKIRGDLFTSYSY